LEDNIKINFKDMGSVWMELAQDHVQWQALLLVMLELWIMLPDLITDSQSPDIKHCGINQNLVAYMTGSNIC
jgi:hypothetical protein